MTKKLQKNIRSSALAVCMAAAACAVPMAANACGAEPYMGEICMTAASYCPNGYLEAQGQLLPIAQNQALFALLGTAYGGNGQTTFGLPDLRSRSPLGLGQGPSLSNIVAGQVRGQESATLTVANLAPHSHTLPSSIAVDVKVPVSSNTTGNTIAPDSSHSYLAASPGGPTAAAIWSSQMVGTATVAGVIGGISGNANTSVTGGGIPVATVPPQLGVRFCLAVNGLFPPRP